MAKASLSLLLLTLLTSLHGSLLVLSLDHDFSYEKVVYDSAEAPLRQSRVDYIIVGGGTTGCPLAATLSQRFSVLVLERGASPERVPNVMTSDGIPHLLTQADNGRTPAERFRSEDGVDHLRGRVLGGTSMINGGQYSRTDDQFIKSLGIEWDNQEVEKAYKWVEDSLVSRPNPPAIGWQAAVRDSLLESRVTPNNLYTLDHRVGTKLTGSTFDNTGRRHGAAELLKKGRQELIRVVVNATVQNIIFSSVATTPTAIGVRYLDSAGRSRTAFVTQRTGEVILSAGALGSPQLLLLSGIGSASYLKSLNIPVHLDLPEVGQSMADNPRNNINLVVPFPLEASLPHFVGITDRYFVDSVSTRLSLSPVPFPFSLIQKGLSTDASVATISLSIPGPLSRGSLRLDSPTDVRVSPLVRFNYYSNSTDLLRCVNATQRIREILRSQSLHQFRFTNLSDEREFLFLGPDPRQLSDDASTREFCRSTVTTSWNYHGGCVVGRVVDADFRVRGTSSLRVMDSSTLPSTPGTNPQATLMMLGRYVGLKMLRERGVQDSVEGHEAY